MGKERLAWIDISKGIAIILMVIGHSSLPEPINRFIWTFHMPLFFIASGYVTCWGEKSIWQFNKGRLKTLALPFLIYSACLFCVMIPLRWIEPVEWIRKGWVSFALWFVQVLFVACVVARVIYAVNNRKYFWCIQVFLIIVGAILSYNDIYLSWSFSSIPLATFFLCIGTELRNRISPSKLDNFGLLIACFIVTVVISHFWRLDMCFNHITPVIPKIVGALSGTLMLFILSMKINRYLPIVSKVLSAIGRDTFVIVAFSQVTIMLLNEFFDLNVLTKYGLLVVVLVVITSVKDGINKLFYTKIL